MLRICIAEPLGKPLLPRISPSGPSDAADLPSGGRTVSTCNTWNPSTPQESAGQSRSTALGFQGRCPQKCKRDGLSVGLPQSVEDYLRCGCTLNRHVHGNGKSLSWMGLTRERWCCAIGLVSRLDMNTCQTSIKIDILL